MEKRYIVLNGDIIGSRGLSEETRKESVKNLKKVCTELNSKFSGALSGDFYVSGRDSIQGVIRKPEKLLEMMHYIEEKMYPHKLRYGIGYGHIDTYGTPLTAEMEGEAFDNATDCIVQTRENKNRILFMSGNNKLDEAVNKTLRDIENIKNQWSEKEYKIYWDYKNNSKYVADTPKIKKLEKIIESENVLSNTLKKI